MINIWFDGWFSSAYNIISGIRNNPDNKPVKIFGTHYKPCLLYTSPSPRD